MVKNPLLGLFEGTESGDLKQIVTHGAFKMQKKRPSREAMINCLYMCMLTVTFEGKCFSFAWIHASGSFLVLFATAALFKTQSSSAASRPLSLCAFLKSESECDIWVYL
jgi:hypothetical protein